MQPILTERPRTPSRKKIDPLATVADQLAAKLPELGMQAQPNLLQALHDLLDGADEAARASRTQLQIHLIKVTDHLISVQGRSPTTAQRLLSTEAAAQLMGCSRPYVAMLIDAKKLAGSSTTEGGHRRVPEASVRDWISAQQPAANKAVADSDYKSAAKDAGMYAVSDADYLTAASTIKGRKRDD
jgi:excisionase family DNA binding protein